MRVARMETKFDEYRFKMVPKEGALHLAKYRDLPPEATRNSRFIHLHDCMISYFRMGRSLESCDVGDPQIAYTISVMKAIKSDVEQDLATLATWLDQGPFAHEGDLLLDTPLNVRLEWERSAEQLARCSKQ